MKPVKKACSVLKPAHSWIMFRLYWRHTKLTHDWIKKKHFPICYVSGELGVEYFCFLCFGVSLNEDLADSDGAAAVS